MMGRLLRRTRPTGDEGYTMLVVLGAMMLLSGLVLASMGYALANIPQSRRSADTRAALAAAQGGIQDYISRLNTCDTYWDKPCGDSDENPALTGWSTVPGTTGTNTARFSQRLLSNPLSAATPGVVRLEVIGEVNGVKRTVVADLSKTGFLKFLYFSDYETFSPSSTAALADFADRAFTVPSNTPLGSKVKFSARSGVQYTLVRPTEDQVKRGCESYYYDGRSTFPRTVRWTEGGAQKTGEVWFAPGDAIPTGIRYSTAAPTKYFDCLTINFSGADSITGPLHTNDAISLNGNASFEWAQTESSWPSSGVARPATNPKNLWYGTGTPQGNKPVYAPKMVMPPTNLNIRRMADGNVGGVGCLYTGPTSIEFLSTGKLKVVSPYTKVTNPGCSPANGTAINGPANGVIYVQDLPASTSDPNYTKSCTGHPLPDYANVSGDVTTYDCRDGDVFVKGVVQGKFSVASAHDVIVVGNVTYKDGLSTVDPDVLGLVAQNNVAVWHPSNDSKRLENLKIDAAIASVNNSFTVQHYDKGQSLKDLTVRGVIVQKFRGPVGMSNGTGYDKDYRYDPRLLTIPPPSFLELQNDAWATIGFSEESSG